MDYGRSPDNPGDWSGPRDNRPPAPYTEERRGPGGGNLPEDKAGWLSGLLHWGTGRSKDTTPAQAITRLDKPYDPDAAQWDERVRPADSLPAFSHIAATHPAPVAMAWMAYCTGTKGIDQHATITKAIAPILEREAGPLGQPEPAFNRLPDVHSVVAGLFQERGLTPTIPLVQKYADEYAGREAANAAWGKSQLDAGAHTTQAEWQPPGYGARQLAQGLGGLHVLELERLTLQISAKTGRLDDPGLDVDGFNRVSYLMGAMGTVMTALREAGADLDVPNPKAFLPADPLALMEPLKDPVKQYFYQKRLADIESSRYRITGDVAMLDEARRLEQESNAQMARVIDGLVQRGLAGPGA